MSACLSKLSHLLTLSVALQCQANVAPTFQFFGSILMKWKIMSSSVAHWCVFMKVYIRLWSTQAIFVRRIESLLILVISLDLLGKIENISSFNPLVSNEIRTVFLLYQYVILCIYMWGFLFWGISKSCSCYAASTLRVSEAEREMKKW